MNSHSAAFAFSADPITLGHEALIRQASNENNRDFRVLIATNESKMNSRTFSIPESIELTRKSLVDIVSPGDIYTVTGSLAHHFLEEDVRTLYRGTRNVVDVAYENSLEFFYRSEHPELEIIRFKSNAEVGEVSSSAVKETLRLDHDIEKFVRPCVKAALESRLRGQYPIGITGQSGSGKGTVSRKMVEIGDGYGIEIHHIDYDLIAHEIYTPSITPKPMYENVRAKIGEMFTGTRLADGSIDRWILRSYVFGGPEATENLEKLNALLRDVMRYYYRKKISGMKGIILVDAALLAEHDMTGLNNHNTLLVSTDDDTRAERILKRSEKAGKILTGEQVRAQMNVQKTTEYQRNRLLKVIDTESYGFVADVDNTNPGEREFEDTFWNMVSKLDTFGEIRGKWVFETIGIPSKLAEEKLLKIRQAYNTQSRHYHNWKHVVAILDYIFDPKYQLNNEERVTLSLAAMYHDIVYTTNLSEYGNNEKLSAEILKADLEKTGMDPKRIEDIISMILDTSDTRLAALFHDFDYAIVGSPSPVYATYAVDVSREWTSNIPKSEFTAGRGKFLKWAIEAGTKLFRTPEFQESHGPQSILNMQNELATLS